MTEVIKGIRVKYLFAECPVKPLDVAVLMGLALLNENDPDLVLLSPVTELLRNEFRSIVDTNTLRLASPFDEFIKLALYTSLVRLVSIAIVRTSLLKYREDVLDANLFASLDHAGELTEKWVWEYNHEREHESLNYQTPIAYAA